MLFFGDPTSFSVTIAYLIRENASDLLTEGVKQLTLEESD